eukprot:COSAG06_NODE_1181_length_10363_cov_10.391563_12_plen_118_part_00
MCAQAKLDLYPLEEIMLPTDQQPPKDMPQIAWSNSGEQRSFLPLALSLSLCLPPPPPLPLALLFNVTECACYASIEPIAASLSCLVLTKCTLVSRLRCAELVLLWSVLLCFVLSVCR